MTDSLLIEYRLEINHLTNKIDIAYFHRNKLKKEHPLWLTHIITKLIVSASLLTLSRVFLPPLNSLLFVYNYEINL